MISGRLWKHTRLLAVNQTCCGFRKGTLLRKKFENKTKINKDFAPNLKLGS